MKLLLTSGGLTNQAIADALIELVSKKASEISIAFVPTAANVEVGDKGWLIDDLSNIKKQNFKSIDIVDIAALAKDQWLPRLEFADVLFFSGGNEQYLARVMQEVGFIDVVANLLQIRVYAGISAGSMVAGKFLSPELLKIVYPNDVIPEKPLATLALFEGVFIPHLNSEYFPHVRKETIEPLQNISPDPIYALDDQCALKIVDGKIEVVGGGEYLPE